MKKPALFLFFMLGSIGVCASAFAKEYPVVKGYGAVTPLPQAKGQPDKSLKYKVLFDVKISAAKTSEVNPGLDRVARFVNLMASAGIKPESLDVVVILSGNATPVALGNRDFKARFLVPNPNTKLIQELTNAGVKIFVCGQSLFDYQFKPEWVNPEVALALGAIVFIPTYELKGYAPVPETN